MSQQPEMIGTQNKVVVDYWQAKWAEAHEEILARQRLIQTLRDKLRWSEARVARLEEAIRIVLADDETGPGGWGPDVTMAQVLTDAMAEGQPEGIGHLVCPTCKQRLSYCDWPAIKVEGQEETVEVIWAPHICTDNVSVFHMPRAVLDGASR